MATAEDNDNDHQMQNDPIFWCGGVVKESFPGGRIPPHPRWGRVKVLLFPKRFSVYFLSAEKYFLVVQKYSTALILYVYMPCPPSGILTYPV